MKARLKKDPWESASVGLVTLILAAVTLLLMSQLLAHSTALASTLGL